MTCIIALEHLSEGALSKKVEVPYDCFNDFYEDPNYSDPSNAAIEPLQDNLTYKDCLYALMLPSACEAANILAYNIGGGSITKFIGMMNEKAKELGCTGTNFVNAHGLHNANNYTTAEDLYKMTKYAYDKFPLFKKITSTYEYEMPKMTQTPTATLFTALSHFFVPAVFTNMNTHTAQRRALRTKPEDALFQPLRISTTISL